MELRHLRYFVAVADHGGISHAAEWLRIAQPAVSRQIQDLEAELGVDLLLREGRRVYLTDAGKSFAEKARRILADAQVAADDARSIAKGSAGELRIGLLESAAWSGHLPIALNRYARAYPNVRMIVKPMGSVGQIDAMLAGELDAAFVYRQDTLNDGALDVHSLRYDDVVFAASTDMVFDRDGELALEDIDGLPLVMFPRAAAPAYYDRLFKALHALGLDPYVTQEAESETGMLSLVSAGVGCTFVNITNMQRPPRRIQFRQVKGLSLPIEFVCVTSKRPGSLTQSLIEIVREIDA